MIFVLGAIGRSVYLLLAFAAVVLFCFAINPFLVGWFEDRKRRAADVQRRLNRDKPVPLSIYGAPVLGFIAFVVMGFAGNWIVGLILGFVVFRVADSLSAVELRKRHAKFDEQLVDALAGLANSTKAGMSLPQAVEQVAKDMPPPVSQEFGDIMREYRTGKPIEQALDDARERIQSRNFDLSVRAFRIGMEQGGNVAQVFEKIAEAIREMWRLQEHVRTVTTEGRSSARFMTLMPAVFLVLLYIMDPQGVQLLFTTTVGLILLTVVLIINLLGHVWIKRILDVDI